MQDRESLDLYTLGLLKDTRKAIKRCQDVLERAPTHESLMSLELTVDLLIDDLSTIPNPSHSAITKLAQYLDRMKQDCLTQGRVGHRSDKVKQLSAVLLAQTLLDRCLTIVKVHLDNHSP